MPSSESAFFIVICWGGYMQEWKHTSSTDFRFKISNESGSGSGTRLSSFVLNCGFPEPSLIWPHGGRDVRCGISDIPGTMSRHSISSPHVDNTEAAASSSKWSLTIAGTLHSDVPYHISLSRMQSTASFHPGCVTSSIFICFYWNLSTRCCTVLVIVRITQPGCSSSLSWPCSAYSSTSSCLSSPSLDLAMSLILSPIATTMYWNFFLASLFVNLACSAFFVVSCSCWPAASASSTYFLATVVSVTT